VGEGTKLSKGDLRNRVELVVLDVQDRKGFCGLAVGPREKGATNYKRESGDEGANSGGVGGPRSFTSHETHK